MSKMGDINLQLEEQAVEQGFAGKEEMERAGYQWRIEEVDGDNIAMWYKPEDDLEEAHKAWEQERQDLLDDLEEALKTVERAIEFVKGAHD